MMTVRLSVAMILAGSLSVLHLGCGKSDSGSRKPVPKPVPGQVTLKVWLVLSGDTMKDTLGNPTNQGCRLTEDDVRAYIHELQKKGPKVFGANSRWVWGFTGANWTDASRQIWKPGAFAGYTWQSGDTIAVTGGTGVTPENYTITAATVDRLTLASDINGTAGDLSDNSVMATFEVVQVVRSSAIPETRSSPERRADLAGVIQDVAVLHGRFDPAAINIYFGGWISRRPDSPLEEEGITADPRDAWQAFPPMPPFIIINDLGWNSGSNKQVAIDRNILEHEVGHYLLDMKNDLLYVGQPTGGEHRPGESKHLMNDVSPHPLVLPAREQKQTSKRIMDGTYNSHN